MTIIFKKVNNSRFSELIYEINNDPLTRKYSVNSKSFSFKKHKAWLKKTLKSKSKKIYLVIENKNVVGLIRLKVERNKNYLSWAVKKRFRGKNIGKKMLKGYVQKNKKVFFAKIKKNNIRSIKVCEYAGFKKFKENLKFKYFMKN